MDMEKIGSFLSALRKEQGLTQEQLGEKIGVTNKTVSRWETGKYMPPVEMLQSLSELYGISINEILSGERLSEKQYKQKAEENIKSVLSESKFTLHDRVIYFKKKWKKEHVFDIVFGTIIIIAVFVFGIIFDNGLQFAALIMAWIFPVAEYNRMMSYVEYRAYGRNETKKGE